MKAVVVGCGLIGLTSAYFLRQSGWEVSVVEREGGPARQTSFANGGLQTPSMSQPWNTPGCWRMLLASVFREDSPLKLRFGAIPSLAGWASLFLRSSRRTRFEQSTIRNLALASYSQEVMESIRRDARIDYGRSARGTLRLFRDDASLQAAVAAADQLSGHGLEFRRLSTEDTIAFEPALVPIADQLVGSIHYPMDEIGDAHRFCVGLADVARGMGVEFRYDTQVSSFEMNSGRVAAVVTNAGRVSADFYVIAAGSYSVPLLRMLGIRLPIRPAKGYSLTLEQAPGATVRVPVIDDDLHAAVVPINHSIRIAGTAEFAGYDTTVHPKRIDNLTTLLKKILPAGQFNLESAKAWCGLRPISADGVPIIGKTSVDNVLINCGHGPLGWTMAAGSARFLADMMSKETPRMDPCCYSLERF